MQKKENIDGYTVYSEDGEFKEIVFKDYFGNEITVSIKQNLNAELIQRRREVYSEEHKIRKHIDKYIYNDNLFEVKTAKLVFSPEELIIAREGKDRIIREIWKLPTPQNRRVYMHIVNGFSLTEIAKIEKRDFAAIKRSTEVGLEKLRKKLKNF